MDTFGTQVSGQQFPALWPLLAPSRSASKPRLALPRMWLTLFIFIELKFNLIRK